MNTTFILGAGASFDCGFPLGNKLYTDILQDGIPATAANGLYQWQQIRNQKASEGYSFKKGLKEKYEQFLPEKDDSDVLSTLHRLHNQLNSSLHESIDYFIDEFPEFAWWAKISIAERLLIKESKLFQNRNWENKKEIWYSELFRSRLLSPAHLKDENVKVITFNYDRSLELYLNHFYRNTYKKSANDEDRENFLKNIPIIHIHGSLGPIDTMEHDLTRYMDGEKVPVIIKAAQNLKTIQEGQSDENFQTAKKWIRQSDKVYVLGFGFNPENTISLFDVDFPDFTVGTAFGHSNVQIREFCDRAGNVFYHPRRRKFPIPEKAQINDAIIPKEPRLVNCSIPKLFSHHYPLTEMPNGKFI